MCKQINKNSIIICIFATKTYSYMKKLPISIFLFVMLMAFVSAFTSYKSTSKRISEDVNNALALTKYQMPCDVVSADTIRCYRNNITIAELRETACLAMRTVRIYFLIFFRIFFSLLDYNNSHNHNICSYCRYKVYLNQNSAIN